MFQNRLEYPLHRIGQLEKIPAYCQWAHVIHVHDDGYKHIPEDYYHKPTLWTFHGSMFRNDPSKYLSIARDRGWRSSVVSVDLLEIAGLDDSHWTPLPRPDLRSMRKARDDDRILLAHAPTNRKAKGTRELPAMDLPDGVEIDMIEGVTYQECIERKARCDGLIDQNTYGYGMNGVEAWAMDLPVFGEFEDEAHELRLRNITDRWGWLLSWDNLVDCDNLDRRLRRAAYFGRQFYLNYHSYPAVARRLNAIYSEMI